jgi:hypothetical protein
MAEPTRPMFEQLSEAHRNVVLTSLKRERGDLSREDFFLKSMQRSSVEVGSSTGQTSYVTLLDTKKWLAPCTDEEAEARAMATIYSDNLLARGVARRIIKDDPEELESALSLEARLYWLEECAPNQGDLSLYPNVWKVFRGLAASDLEVSRAYFGANPRMLRRGHKSTVLIYNAIQATVTNDQPAQTALAPTLESPKVSGCARAILRVVYGIIRANPTLVAEELDQVLRTFRRLDLFDEEKIISIFAHGLAELAYSIDPNLLAEFDVARPLPWDSAYYQWLRRENRSTPYRSMSQHSPLLHGWIHDLEEPSWWYRPQETPSSS